MVLNPTRPTGAHCARSELGMFNPFLADLDKPPSASSGHLAPVCPFFSTPGLRMDALTLSLSRWKKLCRYLLLCAISSATSFTDSLRSIPFLSVPLQGSVDDRISQDSLMVTPIDSVSSDGGPPAYVGFCFTPVQSSPPRMLPRGLVLFR